MADSTSIEKLPNSSNNVEMNIKNVPINNNPNLEQQIEQHVEKKVEQQVKEKMNYPIAPSREEQRTIEEALIGIDEAHRQGMTNLSSRDIPMNTNRIIQDERVKPNYIPQSNNNNYIEEKDTYDSMVEQNKKKEQKQDRLDSLYEELQQPILVSILFFLFQLPVVRTKFKNTFPMVFKSDGNLAFSGYLTKSIIFGGSLYIVLKSIKYLSEI